VVKTSPFWPEMVQRVHPELYRLGRVHGLFRKQRSRPEVGNEPLFDGLFEPCRGSLLFRHEVMRLVRQRYGADLPARRIIPQFRKFADFPQETATHAGGRCFVGWRAKS
jgi:hypothetical protein